MAALLLRSSAGCLSTQLLQRSVPRVSSATLQKRHLTVSPVRQGREYGPSEGKLPAYTSHWTQHRYQMISMIPLIPAALAFPHPVLDLALCGSLVLHSYWGIGGIVSDYFHDKTLNRIGNAILMTVTIAAMAGLFYLTYNDVGFAKTVRKIYSEL